VKQKTKQLRMRITAAQDQDMAKAVAWFKEQDEEALVELWAFIQQDFQNQRLEAMSRMAQLGFASVALEAGKDLMEENQ
jgi:hypothetical protein